ncbi:unnamed protein product [Bemisia tabaci]|uniref:Uncharacterized protein n=1 Tax=Bemisia tabaci TaxID=7038 RepID=A0A9P0APH9_BEMTA|nr:unnamed protein product [Bemisia tabaci]
MGAPRGNYNDSDADQYLGRLGTFTNTMSPKNTSTLAKSPHLASEMIQSYPDFSADFENDLKSYKLQRAMAARAALQRLGAGAMGQEAVDRLRGQRQFSTEEANESRLATKTEWVAETRDGHLRSSFRFLHQKLQMQHIQHLGGVYRITGSILTITQNLLDRGQRHEPRLATKTEWVAETRDGHLRGQRQFSTEEANESRLATKTEWVAETRDGHLRSPFRGQRQFSTEEANESRLATKTEWVAETRDGHLRSPFRGQRQFSTEEANESRLATKTEWVAETRDGHLRSPFRFLHRKLQMQHIQHLGEASDSSQQKRQMNLDLLLKLNGLRKLEMVI